MRKLFVFVVVLLLTVVTSVSNVSNVNAVTFSPPVGKILQTYNAKGGEAVFGAPTSEEIKIRSYSRNTYHKHFINGTVYWDGSQGGKSWLLNQVPSLSRVNSERDALGPNGFKPGVLFRSAKLCDATINNKRLITAMVHGGTILDLRTSGTCSEPTFPSVVAKKRISIPSHANYVRYVTGTTERTQFGKVLTFLANTPGPVWVHCTAGKDRTGWVVMMVMYALGADTGDVLEEFLRTKDADEARFFAGLDAIAEKYNVGGPEGPQIYLRQGLGLSEDTITKLKNKFGV